MAPRPALSSDPLSPSLSPPWRLSRIRHRLHGAPAFRKRLFESLTETATMSWRDLLRGARPLSERILGRDVNDLLEPPVCGGQHLDGAQPGAPNDYKPGRMGARLEDLRPGGAGHGTGPRACVDGWFGGSRPRLSDTTPAIVLLGWYDARNKRNGGHFIVASRVVSSGRVVFLDPWQGQLKELGVGPAYPGAHTSCT